MKKYIPLNSTQRAAINKLGLFFDPTTATLDANQASQDTEAKQTPLNTDTSIPNKYIKATDLLNSQQKEALDKHEEKIQTGFEKYSAY